MVEMDNRFRFPFIGLGIETQEQISRQALSGDRSDSPPLQPPSKFIKHSDFSGSHCTGY